jgi:single-strand DNA-binding protein
MNKAIFDGNLGKDPETKYTQSGKCVCTFSVGVSSGWGDKKRTDWINVVVWDKRAETCSQHLHKGSKVLVEGRIQTRSYDANDGSKRYVTEVVANEVEFLDRKPQGEHNAPQAQDMGGEPVSDEVIPF